MSISLFAIFLYDIDAIEACPQEQKNTVIKIKILKLARPPVFFLWPTQGEKQTLRTE